MKTIDKSFVHMVGSGMRLGRVMSNLDFFEMLNPVDVDSFKVANCTPAPSCVAAVQFSDIDSAFNYRIVLQFFPNVGYRYFSVYWYHRKWNIRYVSSNLYDVLSNFYEYHV